VIRGVSVVVEYAQETFLFLPPYTMEHHGSTSSAINWDDDSIPYSTIIQTLSEATENFTNQYTKGHAKCRLLTDLLDRPITNLDDLAAPHAKASYPVPAAACHVTNFPTRVARRVTNVLSSGG